VGYRPTPASATVKYAMGKETIVSTTIRRAAPKSRKYWLLQAVLVAYYLGVAGGVVIASVGFVVCTYISKQTKRGKELVEHQRVAQICGGRELSENTKKAELFTPHYLLLLQITLNCSPPDLKSFSHLSGVSLIRAGISSIVILLHSSCKIVFNSSSVLHYVYMAL
jgi:hypothetical protein